MRATYFPIVTTCPDCGRTTRRHGLCAHCTKPEGRAFSRGAEHRKIQAGMVHYVVEWAPRGEYSRGAAFVAGEMREGLREGIWTIGMIVRHSVNGHVYVVCRKSESVAPEDADDDWLPAQRLQRVDEQAVQKRLARRNGRCAA